MKKRKYICQNMPYFQYRTNGTIYEVTLSYTTAKGKVAKYLYDAYVEDGVLYVEETKIDVLDVFLKEQAVVKKNICFFTNSFCVTIVD